MGVFFSLNFSSEIIMCWFACGVWIACLANHSEFCEGISTPPARKQMVNTLVEARQQYFFFYRGNNAQSAVQVQCMIETELIQCTLKPAPFLQVTRDGEVLFPVPRVRQTSLMNSESGDFYFLQTLHKDALSSTHPTSSFFLFSRSPSLAPSLYV